MPIISLCTLLSAKERKSLWLYVTTSLPCSLANSYTSSRRRSAGCAEHYPMQSETPHAIHRSRAEVITDFERFLRGFRAGYDVMHSYAQEGDLSRTGSGENYRSIPLFARLRYFRGCITAHAD